MRISRPSVIAPLILVLGIGTAQPECRTAGPVSAPNIADLPRFDDSYYGACETTQAAAAARGTIIK